MKKSYFLNMLSQLEKKIPESWAKDSIEKLKEHIQTWEEESLPAEDFPLPEEFVQGPQHYAVFSDGACRGNPGPGSFGVMIQNSDGEVVLESAGFEDQTTNNRMELTGAIAGLDMLADGLIEASESPEEVEVFLFSDSKYVVEGMKSWIHGWKKRGWKKADKSAPENLDLWKKLDLAQESFKKVSYFWVKGHSGHPQNERCDQLANQALDEAF